MHAALNIGRLPDGIRRRYAAGFEWRARLAGLGIAFLVHATAWALVIHYGSRLAPTRRVLPITVRFAVSAPPEEPASTRASRANPTPPRASSRPPAAPQSSGKRTEPVQPIRSLASTAEASSLEALLPASPAPWASAEASSEPVAPSAAVEKPVPVRASSTAALPVTPPSAAADYLSNPPPGYPAASRRHGEEGTVMLGVFVSEQGLPERIELRKSSGYLRLDEAALAAVRRWRFVPARKGDLPAAAWVVVPVSFSLRS